ncbi:hypothetical protein ACIQVN_06385 [Streptomyces cyaneofuscatus]|uniref:hypothetical protein n=1 Tax=Streptomyces cyaneofuscatus TaxID=66883 RepID=UPI0038011F45
MAWDEWEQLKADAGTGATAMRLNQGPVGPGSASGDSATADLRTDKKEWAKAGEATRRLGEPVGAALGKLKDGQSGLSDGHGLGAAAQKEMYDSWDGYMKSVRKRCQSLGRILESSGHDLAKSDEALKGELDALEVVYVDTETVGGRPGGR